MNSLYNKNFEPINKGTYEFIGPLCNHFVDEQLGSLSFGRGLRVHKDSVGRFIIHKDDHRIFMDRVLLYIQACTKGDLILKEQMEVLFSPRVIQENTQIEKNTLCLEEFE